MKVKRIMANTVTEDLDAAAWFYGELLGLDLLMDHGWFRTYGSPERMMVQVSFGTEGGRVPRCRICPSRWMTWTRRSAVFGRPA